MPSTRRSQTARVASGVTSRGAIPVPPVVTTKRAERHSSISFSWITGCSSATRLRRTTRNLCRSRASATAGPLWSVFSPREHESLTVSTVAVPRSGVEEDIFPLSRVALRFVEQAQALHQKALRVQRGGLLRGLAFEVDLEVSVRPAQNF